MKDKLNSLNPILDCPYIICIDANAHHVSWGSESTDPRGEILAEWLQSNDSALLNDGHPTYLHHTGKYSHIDLTIVSLRLSTSTLWKVHSHPYHSDHMPIKISNSLSFETIQKTPKFIVEKADWSKYQTLTQIKDPEGQASKSCEALELPIINAASASIPQTKTKSSSAKTNSWWTDECGSALKDKNRALLAYKKSKGDLILWIKYKKKKAIFRYIIKRTKKQSWEEFVSQMTQETLSTEVWKKVKC